MVKRPPGDQEFLQMVGNTQLPADPTAIPADMVQQSGSRKDARGLALGSPPSDYGVRSVYDSRPVNATDFNVFTTMSLGCGGSPFVPSGFVVPQGYVAVWRKAYAWMEPPLALSTLSDVLFSFAINGADVQYNANIPIGIGSNSVPLDCFIIADNFQTLSGKFYTSAFSGEGSATANIRLYGNLLQKSGRPSIFEIANYAGQGGPTNTSSGSGG